ncbi:hypothetical protein OESDEN_09434 [Oesophagostomum dentatum]|uniref:Uncharacterized protein n=1 Tax=Oesophagostomum dentatum TaxID=61180 RepID=A0A0B1T5R6_OESDE|nr:hypothetical protein OESDEN_09434 [Oesophagostomum dentatum]
MEKARSQCFRDSFLILAVRTWNSLPEEVVMSSSPASFCLKLEATLRDRDSFNAFNVNAFYPPPQYERRLYNADSPSSLVIPAILYLLSIFL